MGAGELPSFAAESDYDEPAWLDAYATTLVHCKPGMTPDGALQAAREAYAHEGWANPKVAAGLDALLGPPSG